MPSAPRLDPVGHGLHIAVAVAHFNAAVTERLLQGALVALRAAGVADDCVTVTWVPGAFELPLCCRWLAETGRFDAVLALGAVIRGDTDHYDHVCRAATEGVLRVNLDTGVPIAFGVLTCDNEQQALARAGGSEGNKGADVANAALAMAVLRETIRGGDAEKAPRGS